MEKSFFDLVRSTKIEAPLIGLWPKSFVVTVTRRLDLTPTQYLYMRAVSRIH